jgi:peptide deformylase
VEGTEKLARCIQHESDHLDGVLFLDRLDAATRKQALKEIRQAEWFDGGVPVMKQSPHAIFGRAN